MQEGFPAGWYPDPHTPGASAYWDGRRWGIDQQQPGDPLPSAVGPGGEARTDPQRPGPGARRARQLPLWVVDLVVAALWLGAVELGVNIVVATAAALGVTVAWLSARVMRRRRNPGRRYPAGLRPHLRRWHDFHTNEDGTPRHRSSAEISRFITRDMLIWAALATVMVGAPIVSSYLRDVEDLPPDGIMRTMNGFCAAMTGFTTDPWFTETSPPQRVVAGAEDLRDIAERGVAAAPAEVTGAASAVVVYYDELASRLAVDTTGGAEAVAATANGEELGAALFGMGPDPAPELQERMNNSCS